MICRAVDPHFSKTAQHLCVARAPEHGTQFCNGGLSQHVIIKSAFSLILLLVGALRTDSMDRRTCSMEIEHVENSTKHVPLENVFSANDHILCSLDMFCDRRIKKIFKSLLAQRNENPNGKRERQDERTTHSQH